MIPTFFVYEFHFYISLSPYRLYGAGLFPMTRSRRLGEASSEVMTSASNMLVRVWMRYVDDTFVVQFVVVIASREVNYGLTEWTFNIYPLVNYFTHKIKSAHHLILHT